MTTELEAAATEIIRGLGRYKPDAIMVPRNVLDEVIAELRHVPMASAHFLVRALLKIRDAQTEGGDQ